MTASLSSFAIDQCVMVCHGFMEAIWSSWLGFRLRVQFYERNRPPPWANMVAAVPFLFVASVKFSRYLVLTGYGYNNL